MTGFDSEGLEGLEGLREQAEALADRRVSSRELVERSLRRIEATQPTINAFRVVRADAALRRCV